MAQGRPQWTRSGAAHRAATDAHRHRGGPLLIPLADVGCTCRSRSPTTPTSTRPSSTPPTSARSCGPASRRCCRTGGTCRSATTGGPAPWSSPARRSPGRPGQLGEGRLRSDAAAGHRGRGRLRGGRAARRADPYRATSPSTSSASCWSTTGRPGTSRPGSTSRSARSSASRSPPRSRLGGAAGRARRACAGADAGPGAARLPAGRAGISATTCGWRCEWNDTIGQRAAVRGDVLDPGTAARPPDRERRVGAHR